MDPDSAPPAGYPRTTPLTPRQWIVVAVVGAVLVIASVATNVEVTADGRMGLGITPLMILGVILVVVGILMYLRAARRRRAEADPLPPPPPMPRTP